MDIDAFISVIEPIFLEKLSEHIDSPHSKYIACSHNDRENDIDYCIIMNHRKGFGENHGEPFMEIFIREMDFINRTIRTICVYPLHVDIYANLQDSCSVRRTNNWLYCKFTSKRMGQNEESTRRPNYMREY